MARRSRKARPKRTGKGRKTVRSKRSVKRPTRKVAKKSRPARSKAASAPTRAPISRQPANADVVQTPPSSLNMNRRGTAARSGRAEMAVERERHRSFSPELAGGDADVELENAYFTGDETAGGDNPTPDQDLVDDIGRAVGVEFQDNEELDTEKVTERDKHRWELDPASAEDYKDRG